jgi:hypothetical protein
MKTGRARFAVIAFFGSFAAAACTSIRPPQELVDARAAYARAYVGPAAQANVAGLHDARSSLDEAEAKFADDPVSEETRHLAYLAHRRVLLAETNARAIVAAGQRARAEQALASAKARPKLHDGARTDDREKARRVTPP